MVMKKVMVSNSMAAMINSTSSEKDLFPPGFRYRMDSIIYTVRRDCTQDVTAPMREVILSDGATEIISVESLLKDIKEIQNSRNKIHGEIMDPDERYQPQPDPVVKKKVIKKKAAKKRVVKKTTKKKVAKKKKSKT